MVVYEINESIGDNEHQEVYCLYCGTKILNNPKEDEEYKIGKCKHLVYACTNETWEEPEYSSENIFENYDVESDDYHDDFLKRTLGDEYLMVVSCGPSISGLDGITIFKQ